MTEKEQLIQNIVLSEIQYIQKMNMLADPEIFDDLREKICDSLDRDHEIIAIWCKNYKISRTDIEKKRAKLLSENMTIIEENQDRDIGSIQKTIDELSGNSDNQLIISAKLREIERIKIDTAEKSDITDSIKDKLLLWQL